MKRYYLCPVLTEQDPDLGTVRRLKLPAGMNHSAVIADGLNWGVAIVASNNFTALDADTALNKLPEITMDATLQTISNGQRNTLLNKLASLGVNIAGITSSTTMRQLLQTVGQHLDPNFNTSAFDISD